MVFGSDLVHALTVESPVRVRQPVHGTRQAGTLTAPWRWGKGKAASRSGTDSGSTGSGVVSKDEEQRFKKLFVQWWKDRTDPKVRSTQSLMEYVKDPLGIENLKGNDNRWVPLFTEAAADLFKLPQRHKVTGKPTTRYLNVAQVARLVGVDGKTPKAWELAEQAGTAAAAEPLVTNLPAGEDARMKLLRQRWRDGSQQRTLFSFLDQHEPKPTGKDLADSSVRAVVTQTLKAEALSWRGEYQKDPITGLPTDKKLGPKAVAAHVGIKITSR